jgi:hypothetical protein
MLLSQGDHLAGARFIKLDNFEIAQEILHAILIFGIASTGEHLDPTDTGNRQTGITPDLVVSLFPAVKQVDQDVGIEDGLHEAPSPLCFFSPGDDGKTQ